MEESNIIEYIKIFLQETRKRIVLIILSFLIIYASSFYIIYNNETLYEGQISIKKIPLSEFEDLRQINTLLINAQRSINSLNSTDLEKESNVAVVLQNEVVSYAEYMEFKRLMEMNIYDLNRDKLQEIFIDELFDNNELVSVLDSLKILERSKFDSEEEYYEGLRKISNEIKISKPVVSERQKTVMGRGYQEDYIVSFQAKTKQLISQIFNDTLLLVNKNGQKSINNHIQLLISELKQDKEFKIEDTIKSIGNAKTNYIMETNKKLKLLEEQAKIARILDIETNKISSTENILNSKSTILTTIYEKQLYYLLGYKAIEGEIELVKSRTEDDIIKLVPDLINLDNQLREINQNQSISRFEERYKNSNLYREGIDLVKYDPLNIRFSTLHSSDLKIFLLSTLLFIIVSSLIIISSLLIRAIREK